MTAPKSGGFRWGMKALFGKPKVPPPRRSGGKCSLFALAILAALAAGIAAAAVAVVR